MVAKRDLAISRGYSPAISTRSDSDQLECILRTLAKWCGLLSLVRCDKPPMIEGEFGNRGLPLALEQHLAGAQGRTR
jgi:hypothetical protein